MEQSRTYHTLDALRGIAALIVITPHAPALLGDIRFPAAFIAVDLFFMLSGFVLMHAYEARLGAGMNTLSFLRLRLVRLYPLYLLGFLVALGATCANVLSGAKEFTPEEAVAAILNPVMLPSPSENPHRALYVFNFPAWSLLFELVVNLIFAIVGFRFSLRAIGVVIAISAAAMIALTWEFQTLDMGVNWAKFWGGIARATFGFFVGMMLYRLRSRVRIQSPSAVLGLAIATVATFLPGLDQEIIGHYKFIAVTLLFALGFYPLLIWLAARYEPNGVLLEICSFLGVTSYAIYVLHVPIYAAVDAATNWAGIAFEAYAPWSGLVFIPVVVLCAWLADKYWDRPIRAWLSRRRRSAVSDAP